MTSPGTPIRTVEIRGPSAQAETRGVFRAATLIAFASLCFIGRNWTEAAGSTGPGNLPPYQQLFRELSPVEQRTFRAVQEGLTEAENARGRSGQWPVPEELAGQGIPPFAPDPLQPGMRWVLKRSGATVNYFGASPTPEGPAYLVVVLEPEPGVPGDPPETPSDESHHRLSDGTMLHVSIWLRAQSPSPDRLVISRPYEDGWKQILVAEPSFPKERR